jgi:hypothetical protein
MLHVKGIYLRGAGVKERQSASVFRNAVKLLPLPAARGDLSLQDSFTAVNGDVSLVLCLGRTGHQV